MKITIDLTDAEANGIKAYLKAVDDIAKPTKADVKQFVQSMVNAIHSPHEAVSDYIRAEEEKQAVKQN